MEEIMSSGYEIAKEKDIRELFDLQLRAFESEAEMIGSRNVPALMESLEENRSWLHRNTGTAVLRSV